MARTWKEDPTSRRTSPRPVGWGKLREKVFTPDGRACQLRLSGFCIGTATEVDHIGDHDDHDMANLRPVCTPCHRRRTALQAAAARHAGERSRAAAKAEPHPGLLPAPAASRADSGDSEPAIPVDGVGGTRIDTHQAPGTA